MCDVNLIELLQHYSNDPFHNSLDIIGFNYLYVIQFYLRCMVIIYLYYHYKRGLVSI